MVLRLYNSLTRKKEEFIPLDPANVRMYVCGPTVYDHAHIGNARPVIVFDVLYRLLRHLYGDEHVTYVRNITDVDDKIMERAAAEKRSIKELTKTTTDQFHADVAALGCLPPDIEPRATEHIEEMKALIQTLIAKDHAYEAEGHVLFAVEAWSAYGELSGRSTDEMIAGARVEVAPYKKNPMDFVLWKPSAEDQPGWDSDWGRGRPGWHIECSAMAEKHLGQVFDIHGGGVDLKFPHHENEIAQSRCAFGSGAMANYWMHNGFLQVEGEKMSKSLGNFLTIRELLETGKFGKFPWQGQVLRYAMLMTHYRKPIDFTVEKLEEADVDLMEFKVFETFERRGPGAPSPEFLDALKDDLNTPRAITELRRLLKISKNPTAALHARAAQQNVIMTDEDNLPRRQLVAGLNFLGIKLGDFDRDLQQNWLRNSRSENFTRNIQQRIDARNAARNAKNFADADRIRDELAAEGVILKDNPDGKTDWEIVR